MKLCKGCMEHYSDDLKVCPHCGYENGSPPKNPLHMMPGSLLADRYIVGKVLGFGGFGVTYIAWDGLLQTKVAIKEYFPSDLSTRTLGETQIVVYGDEKKQRYGEGMKKFVNEAKKLAKFNTTEGIVKIFGAFESNNTAYIVMELLEGETIEEFLKREKKVSAEEAVRLMMPVLESLQKVHDAGIVHRDISPDNLIITKKGEVKLIDFGAARYATADDEKSLTVMIKKGYSPEEQYRSHGGVGKHTDVYAAAATLYRMISGKVPPDSLERYAVFENKGKDILPSIRKYDRSISENYETAIMNALNIRAEDRTADISDFISELTVTSPVAKRAGNIKKVESFKWPMWAKIGIPCASVCLVVFGVLFGMGIIGSPDETKVDTELLGDRTRVPYVVSKEIDEGAKKLTEAQLNMQIIGKKESNKIPEDHIISQDINEGSVVRKNTIVNVKVSSPDLLQVVPNMMGMDAKESSKTCDELGLKIKTDEQYSSVIEKGCVVSQSVEPYEEVEDESEISVTVSKGRAEDIKEEEITVPNFVGMKYDEVLTQAEEMNCTIKVTDREYNKDYDRDVTISQSPAADTKIKNTQAIEITASLGNEMVKVPNVELRSEAKAKVQLSGRGLESNVRYESNEMILEGLVISQEPKKDTNVDPESTVELVVSTGAAPVDMPNVVGMQEDEANETLVNSGFSVTLDYKHSESDPEGEVILQSVSAGSKVKRGDEIIITVATNSSTIEVPNLIGQTKSAAEKEIKNKGLTSNLNYISENNRSDGVVVSQIPAPGINVKPKSVVTINIDLISEESDNSEIESRGENSETSTVNTSNSDTDKKDSDSNIDTSKDNEIESKTDTDTRSKKESDTDRRAESTVSSRKDSDTSSNSSSSSTSSQESSSSQTTTSVSSRPTSSVTSSQTSSNNNTTSSKGNSSKTTSSNTVSNTEIKVTGIIISESNVSMTIGETRQITASVSPSNATNTNVDWSSNNNSVASVNNGLITANGEGTAIITASAYGGVSVDCTVTVTGTKRENSNLLKSGDCGDFGDNVQWELYESGTMYLFGNGKMQNYEPLESQESHSANAIYPFRESIPWYNYFGNIRHIIIEDGVTSIGASVFRNANNLESIEIADSVAEIYSNAFEGCVNLSRVDLPKNLRLLDTRAFALCPIKEIEFPEKLEVINFEVFYNGSETLKKAYFKGNKPVTDQFQSTYNSGNVGTGVVDWEEVYYPANNPTWDLTGDFDELVIFGENGKTKFIPYNP